MTSELRFFPFSQMNILIVVSVVFSTWRLTLDVVEKGLEKAGIRSIRFDGSVPQKERQSVVDKFKADPGVRVMLLTLSCGAVG
jgi:SNF2 family DNA or RNA helicase